ncbi:transferase 2, rSAM/selenodomain-associated [Reichenbachiella faecimaris]|uniref:Transferase 2, rSAM/selenodomain-associated n=1 Tax=Reichenbachiella faecimaris TaxID=692418 RepID=A0A1W2G6U3_REIFA|nr:TIGR04283 family arsenosugar biosynthesis glycosyltransferase [Reichenbachiella faecimaris]SMD32385.1 transferase 2, rSAM/selenodomain-associated [Reichenbachiella faecimaris]
MNISIIIPTLNEANYISQTIDRIRANQSKKSDIEIIVVDAGSRDDTVGLVTQKVNQVYEDSSLAGAKYKSLNQGAKLAKGAVLLFLDADTFLPPNFDKYVEEALSQHGVVGGAFEFGFDRKGIIYRMIQWVNRIRYRVDKRYFGDQGIFCSQKVFEQVGGYPNQPIMEAAYLCKALRKLGQLALIKVPIITSTRRFEQGNIFSVFLKDTWIWIQFTLGLNIKRYALAYWKENENGG